MSYIPIYFPLATPKWSSHQTAAGVIGKSDRERLIHMRRLTVRHKSIWI